MATDEDMAIRFYNLGDAADLAEQLVAILESPRLEHQMRIAQLCAGVEMTMSHRGLNYLRWFKLNSCKKVICKAAMDCAESWHSWLAGLRARETSPALSLPAQRFPRNGTALGNCDGLEPARSYVDMATFAHPFSGRQSKPPERS